MRRFLVFLVVSLGSLMTFLPPASASSELHGKHVIVLLVDNTSIQNWAYMRLPNLQSLAKEGAVALMNSNTAGHNDRPEALLTMAASAHLKGIGPEVALDSGQAFEGRPVASLYQGLWGALPPPGSVVSLDYGENAPLNAGNPYTFTMGALAQEIMKAGGTTAVFGNGDLPFSPGIPGEILDRSGALLAMNSQGIATQGNVGDNLLSPTPGAPFGTALNNSLLLSQVLSAYGQSSLLVVDYGDTVRADAWRKLTATSQAANAATDFGLHHFDQFLGSLLPHIDRQNTLIIVVSTAPSDLAATEHESLTPILVVGPNYQPGELSSATTHRHGIISNVDFAPTILHFLGITPPDTMFGQPAFSQPATNTLSQLASTASVLAFQSYQRLPVLKTLVYVIVFVFVGAILYLILSRRHHPVTQQILNILTHSVLFMPLGILLAPLGSPSNLGMTFFLIIGFVILATGLTRLFTRHSLDRILVPCILTVGVLLLDLFTGTHLIQNSALGYDPQIGARYYGIGNEYMGVLVGSSAIGFTALLERIKKPWLIPVVILVFAVIIGALVAPGLGTKAGGAITATAALGVVTLRLTGRKIGWRQVLGIAGTIVGLLLLLVVADLLLHSRHNQTDIGRAGALIVSGGPQQALFIIMRKLGTNLSLVQGSYWTTLFVVALAMITASLTILVGTWRDITSRYQTLAFGLIGSVVGAAVGFVFNDTGVVAACTTIIFPIATALLLDLGQEPLAGRLPEAASRRDPHPAS